MEQNGSELAKRECPVCGTTEGIKWHPNLEVLIDLKCLKAYIEWERETYVNNNYAVLWFSEFVKQQKQKQKEGQKK
jgi:hypothetical protein